MDTHIIKDYGQTVSPEVYIHALQGHQYIPQADECIKRIIDSYRKKNGVIERLLDVGCGPGRLTQSIAFEHDTTIVLGVDVSPSFIEYAEKRKEGPAAWLKLQYLCQDFCVTDSKFVDRKWDVILMQGVMHHIHGDDRGIFKKRCLDLLKPGGILLIGDEFVKDYPNEATRRHNVCKFYLHIIDEARKGGFTELAREEAKNLIDDVLSGEEGAGFADDELIEKIYEQAQLVNKSFYMKGLDMNSDVHSLATELIRQIRQRSKTVSLKPEALSFNRGDLKVSTSKFKKEMEYEGFVLEEMYQMGPVDQLGGMAVMVFMKR